MQNRILTLIVVVVIFLVACQREIDWGLGGTSDKLLIKIFSKTGPDSTVTFYNYNSAKQLIGENIVGFSGGNSVDNDLRIYRTASGIIDRTVQVSSALVASGIDSIVTRYNYSASRYTFSVFSITLSGTTVVDSAVYTYDASGKITTDEHYLKAGILPPMLALRNQYTYTADGLNLSSVQQFAATIPGGPLSPVSTQTYTFDTKKSPLILKQEAIVLIRPSLFNAQNAVRAVVSNTIDPSQNFQTDITYTYNTLNKPDSSVATRTPGGAVTVSKYFYQ